MIMLGQLAVGGDMLDIVARVVFMAFLMGYLIPGLLQTRDKALHQRASLTRKAPQRHHHPKVKRPEKEHHPMATVSEGVPPCLFGARREPTPRRENYLFETHLPKSLILALFPEDTAQNVAKFVLPLVFFGRLLLVVRVFLCVFDLTGRGLHLGFRNDFHVGELHARAPTN
ncbi:hypothetical protein IAD21_00500 [Abditibacteriota bacterium]|nr:hypothetical protein IAD21_00500 [Abditibacteriota bacterium]